MGIELGQHISEEIAQYLKDETFVSADDFVEGCLSYVKKVTRLIPVVQVQLRIFLLSGDFDINTSKYEHFSYDDEKPFEDVFISKSAVGDLHVIMNKEDIQNEGYAKQRYTDGLPIDSMRSWGTSGHDINEVSEGVKYIEFDGNVAFFRREGISVYIIRVLESQMASILFSVLESGKFKSI